MPRSLGLVSLSLWLTVVGGQPLAAQSSDVLSQLTGMDVRLRLEGAARGFPGLDAPEIERDIRELLSSAGLQVADVTSGPGAGQAPIFEVLLVMYSDSARARRYAFTLTATITEGVMLRRGEPRRIWAQTWNGPSTVGIVGADGAEMLRSDIRSVVEKFVRDYLAANKREGPGKREAFAPL